MSTFHVLIVDDQRDTRSVLRAALETMGHEVKVTDVPSGEEALLLLSRQSFDLMIVDVRLPGMNGLELKAKVGAIKPDLKLIVITGLTDPHIRQQIATLGADAFFFKPIEIPDFLEAVERCFGLAPMIRPPEPEVGAAISGTEHAEMTLSERLTNLRRETDAAAVFLLNDAGRRMAAAGDVPEGLDWEPLLLALMSALSASARVSQTLNFKIPQDVMFYSGMQYDLLAAHVGGVISLAVLVRAGREERLPELITTVWSTVEDLLPKMEELGISSVVPESPALSHLEEQLTEEELAPTDLEPALEEIFGQAAQQHLKPEEVDAFWDALADAGEQEGVINADALSYEQALKLGLAPEDTE